MSPRLKKITNSEKQGGGMVEVGRRGEVASPPKPIVGSKRSYPEKKKLASTQKMGAAGCSGGLGGTGERAHPSRCSARRGHNRKGTKLAAEPRARLLSHKRRERLPLPMVG